MAEFLQIKGKTVSDVNAHEKLDKQMTLDQIQNYMLNISQIRGFTHETSAETMLILLEEVGELAKALRKHSGLKVDHTRLASYGNLKHEIADVCICLMMLANKCHINLFEALDEKEQINSQRTWHSEQSKKYVE